MIPIAPIKLTEFLKTDIGHDMWDSHELRLVKDNINIFILYDNEIVAIDTLNLTNQDNKFNPIVDALMVTGIETIGEANIFYVKEVGSNASITE